MNFITAMKSFLVIVFSLNQLLPLISSQDAPLSRSAELGRGVNFGNMLDGWQEGSNGFVVKDEYFGIVKQVGMTHIRLPVSFTYYAESNAIYTLNTTFLSRIDEILDRAINKFGIKVILDQHHYDDLQADPVREEVRALSIWRQLATRYRYWNETMLYFEIQNEPHGKFNEIPSLWNEYLRKSLAVIRATNPTRKVLVGPTQWNGIAGLDSLILPADNNLILSMHYYSPFDFTHQGAEWIQNVPAAGSVDWNPEVCNIYWWDYSWGLIKSLNNNTMGLKVQYTNGWSMLSYHRPDGVRNISKVIITINCTTSMKLGLRVSKGKNATSNEYSFQGGNQTFNTKVGIRIYTFNISSQAKDFSEIHLQNMSPDPKIPIFLNNYYLITSIGEKIPVIVSQKDALELDLAKIVRWSNAQRIPIPVHLGEFGTYKYAPLPSRGNWTRAVRKACESMRIDWAYWELAAGFGFWDTVQNKFIDEIKSALVEN